MDDVSSALCHAMEHVQFGTKIFSYFTYSGDFMLLKMVFVELQQRFVGLNVVKYLLDPF